MKLKNKTIIYMMVFIYLLFIFTSKTDGVDSVEDLNIQSAIGNDKINTVGGNQIYSVPISVYVFEEDKITSKTYTTKALNIGETREVRQTKLNKKYLIGLEKIYVMGEEQARAGLKNINDIIFATSTINDSGIVLVCKGKAEDILRYKVKGYPSSADYIEGMAKKMKQYMFFNDKFTIANVYMNMQSEAINQVIPYIEIKNDGLEITGSAFLEDNKMKAILNMQDTKLMNFMRNSKVKGMLTIEENSNKYINCYVSSTKKVECFKDKDKLHFIINIKCNGEIVSNELYKDIINDQSVKKNFENDVKKQTKEKCIEFIKKMQNEYKLDLLELGKYAVAKYGRNTGTDYDKKICDAIIDVNVDVKVTGFGRGEY